MFDCKPFYLVSRLLTERVRSSGRGVWAKFDYLAAWLSRLLKDPELVSQEYSRSVKGISYSIPAIFLGFTLWGSQSIPLSCESTGRFRGGVRNYVHLCFQI